MPHSWQDLTAIGIVAVALLYFAVHSLRALRRKNRSGCGGCSACPAKTSEKQPLITIVPPRNDDESTKQ